MNRILLFLFLLPFSAFAQPEGREALYFPEQDAIVALDSAVAEASASGKHIMLQVGGNWCVWCYRFHDFVAADSALSTFLDENYVVLHVNYSPENKNEELLSRFGFPQRFGFPVFMVLDSEGNRLHTQNSAYLESGKGYDKDAVMDFFKHWTAIALDPDSYR